jgi:hypothetical protein
MSWRASYVRGITPIRRCNIPEITAKICTVDPARNQSTLSQNVALKQGWLSLKLSYSRAESNDNRRA